MGGVGSARDGVHETCGSIKTRGRRGIGRGPRDTGATKAGGERGIRPEPPHGLQERLRITGVDHEARACAPDLRARGAPVRNGGHDRTTGPEVGGELAGQGHVQLRRPLGEEQDIGGRADFSFLSTSIPGNTTFPASGGSSFASMLLGQAFLRMIG